MNCCGYDRLFNENLARKDARRYRRKGLRGTGRQMVELLRRRGLEGAEILEIGGGVGALGIELLEAGAVRSTNLELSPGYESVARELARERELEGRIELRIGDVVSDTTVPAADFVVMERVVCCYPDAAALVGAAATRARRALALTYPRYGALTRVIVALINLGMRIGRHDFRTFAHRPETIHAAAAGAGLAPLGGETGVVWRLAVFERVR